MVKKVPPEERAPPVTPKVKEPPPTKGKQEKLFSVMYFVHVMLYSFIGQFHLGSICTEKAMLS